MSNAKAFTVNNPAPSITALEPAVLMAGSGEHSFNVYGTGFFEDTDIYFDGKDKLPMYISNSKLEVSLTADDLKLPGMFKISAYNASPGGGGSNEMTFTVKTPLEVNITSPVNNTTVDKTRILVRGTFKAGNRDVGITVNGRTTEIMGNEWVVNDVPLDVGANIITATIKDSADSQVNEAININAANLSQPVRLSANLTSGIPPLTTHFSVYTEMTNPIVSYKLDYEGDGVVDYVGSSMENISHTYLLDGMYYPTISVIDSQGNAYSDTIALAVVSRLEMETLLKGKWERMKQALKQGSVEEGLEYFAERSKERYRSVFVAIKDQLPVILETFIEFNVIDVYERIAEYEVIANEGGVLYSYPGIFIKGGDGLWKFRDF